MRTLQGLTILACLAVTMAAPADNKAVQAVSQGINQFSAEFFNEVAKSNSGNLISSPLSASIALTMAGYGARGETEKEFKQVLHLPEESVGRTGYANLIDSLNSVNNVELRLANKVFVNQNFEVKPSYKQLTESAFRSASQNVNFANSVSAANTINKWCEEQTNHRIKDLIAADKLSGDTAMVLVNAVYFKGNWASKFNPKHTADKPFHVTKSKVVNVPTMFKNGNFKYGVLPEMKASFIELPYKGNELSMVIILPDEIDGLAAVEEELAKTNLADVLRHGYNTEVSLHLPKFKIESSFDLGDVLKNMGLNRAFEMTADFSGISDTGVYISSVVQKAFIEVNEEGSEAAGATALTLMLKTIVYNPEFVVDRPFYYAIVKVPGENGNDEPLSLFTGHVIEPRS